MFCGILSPTQVRFSESARNYFADESWVFSLAPIKFEIAYLAKGRVTQIIGIIGVHCTPSTPDVSYHLRPV